MFTIIELQAELIRQADEAELMSSEAELEGHKEFYRGRADGVRRALSTLEHLQVSA